MSLLMIAAVTGVIGTLLSVDTQIKQGKAQEIEAEQQADQEKTAAESRELQRRQQLNKVLAANAVSQSMSGITGEGTPQSIAIESAKQVGISEGVEALTSKLRQSQLARQGKNARSAAIGGSASTLLKGMSSVAMMGASSDTPKGED